MSERKKYLVIRPDNIGDLVCTTPLLRLLRSTYPQSRLDVLVNSYNKEVVTHHPDIDHIYVYTKAKHRATGISRLTIYWQKIMLLWKLRQEKYDVIFLAQRTHSKRLLRLAWWFAARKTVYFADKMTQMENKISLSLQDYENQPEAVAMAAMLTALGIDVQHVPPCSVFPDSGAQQEAFNLLKQQSWYSENRPTLAIHISARKPSQRWPVRAFSTLIRMLAEQYRVQFVVFWSPGNADNRLHPGDDEKAQELMESVADLPVLFFPANGLTQLIAGLSICDQIICSDGGAMHVAAGLGKPVTCLFGWSNAAVWHPWGVPYRLLQPLSRQVKDITDEEVKSAFAVLQDELSAIGTKNPICDFNHVRINGDILPLDRPHPGFCVNFV